MLFPVAQFNATRSASQGLHPSEFYLLQNGRVPLAASPTDPLLSCTDVHIALRLVGGKGGFGSMLRAIGAQIEKTTNREACRDLSGRRLRDINEEKRLKTWLDGQKDRETEAEEKKKKKIEKLQAKPKHVFEDKEYEQSRQELTQNVSDSVEEGFRKAAAVAAAAKKVTADDDVEVAGGSGVKRKATSDSTKKANKNKNKKKKNRGAMWLGDDLSSSSDTDSEAEQTAESADKKETEV